jgi:hypothetical protein
MDEGWTMRGRSLPLVVMVLTLALTACGARLTEEQREFAVGGGGVGQGPTMPGGTTDDASDLSANDAATMADSGDAGAEVGGPGGTGGGAGSSGGGSSAEGGTDGGEASGAEDEAGGTSGGAESWREVPEGGNGGATDVGVTEEAVVIANVSDISGPVPGIFEDAQLAAAAYAAYHNASEGPIYGRQIQYLPLDSRLDSGQNRQQYLRACDEAFGVAGSMSAFEEGAADPVAGCGIPDMRAVATSRPMQQVDNVYSTQVQVTGQVVAADYRFWAEEYPDAVKNAGYLYLENETTSFQSGQNRAATEKLGYDWKYVQSIQIAETNYNGFVIELKERDIGYLTFMGDYSQAVRLANAMRQQNYWPEVFSLQTNIYKPEFLQSGGEAIEGTQIGVTTALLEEIDGNEEMQLYREWLQQVDPSAEPTSLGMLGWSAMKLFVEGLKEVGPEPTREAMLEFLSGVRDWDGGGLHPPQHIGPKEVSSCTNIVEVSGGAFQRLEPADGGFRCDEPISVG